MRQLNYSHLNYFYCIAREGSIVNAAKILHLTPQTLSGQLTTFENYLGVKLFDRVGKRLVLNDRGKMVFSYAEDIFSLGNELQYSLANQQLNQQLAFSVGVIDVVPKILAFDLLKSGFEIPESLKLISRESDLDSLLADLALNKLDLIISDRPMPPGSSVKAYNHFLGETGLTFYAEKKIARSLKQDFPYSLDKQSLLTSGDKSSQKLSLLSWFDDLGITPEITAEFDDSALMKFFGQSGYGVFSTPSIIEDHVVEQYKVSIIGRTQECKERLYAISPERKLQHPAGRALVDAAKELFLTYQ